MKRIVERSESGDFQPTGLFPAADLGRMIIISGSEGQGKTTLALNLTERLLTRCDADQICLVDADPNVHGLAASLRGDFSDGLGPSRREEPEILDRITRHPRGFAFISPASGSGRDNAYQLVDAWPRLRRSFRYVIVDADRWVVARGLYRTNIMVLHLIPDWSPQVKDSVLSVQSMVASGSQPMDRIRLVWSGYNSQSGIRGWAPPCEGEPYLGPIVAALPADRERYPQARSLWTHKLEASRVFESVVRQVDRSDAT